MSTENRGNLKPFCYTVHEFVTTFLPDPHNPGEFQNFSEETDFYFDPKDPLKCRKDALDFYEKRRQSFYEGNASFHLPFAGPDEFKLGENAAYSVQLYLTGENPLYPALLGLIEKDQNLEIPDEERSQTITLCGTDESCNGRDEFEEFERFLFSSNGIDNHDIL